MPFHLLAWAGLSPAQKKKIKEKEKELFGSFCSTTACLCVNGASLTARALLPDTVPWGPRQAMSPPRPREPGRQPVRGFTHFLAERAKRMPRAQRDREPFPAHRASSDRNTGRGRAGRVRPVTRSRSAPRAKAAGAACRLRPQSCLPHRGPGRSTGRRASSTVTSMHTAVTVAITVTVTTATMDALQIFARYPQTSVSWV